MLPAKVLSNLTEKNEDSRILEEEVKGVIPAIAWENKGPLQCGLVFATHIIIVAFFSSKIAQFAGAIRTPDYHIMKKAWAKFEHKSTGEILKNKQYKCYIIPYSSVTHMRTAETGRIRKRSILHIYTPGQVYVFTCTVRAETLGKDIGELLCGSGIRFSKGE